MTFIININSVNFKLLCRIVKPASFASVDRKLKLTTYYFNYFINYSKRFSISTITAFFTCYLASNFEDLFNLRTNIKFTKFCIFILNLQIKVYSICFYYSYLMQNVKCCTFL
jgi:hypothetical protein